MNYIPTRTETIHIAVDLDKSAYERHKADIKLLAPWIIDVYEGDKIALTYEFNVEYFGSVEVSLDAISRIANEKKLVRHVKISELKRGRSVIVDVLAKLTRLINKLEGKKGPGPC